jgi:hypothetical protein
LGEDFHLQAVEHAQHTTKPLARRTLARVRRGAFARIKISSAGSTMDGNIRTVLNTWAQEKLAFGAAQAMKWRNGH